MCVSVAIAGGLLGGGGGGGGSGGGGGGSSGGGWGQQQQVHKYKGSIIALRCLQIHRRIVD